ncbi:ATP-binding protein [Streptacidiphilus sp. EB129]|uniref:ATP-binding protein n=1 Tax=Streptacidiphilus sp. EB129 TaxID=3156262 RepID=UPI0035132E43
MNPRTVGGGNGPDGRPSHDVPTAASPMDATSPMDAASPMDDRPRIPVQPPAAQDWTTANLPALRGGSTDLVRTAAVPALVPTAEPPAEGAADGRLRSGTVVAGDLLLHVNAPDGTVVEDCPPQRRPQPVPAAAHLGRRSPAATPGLLERGALLDQLRDLLVSGRSVRLTGPAGSGRSAVLDAVAAACGGLAPAGVVRLSGHARTSGDLLQDLFAATHDNPGFRPGRGLLPELLRDVCAIVVIDDVPFGGEMLEELLATAPDCAFLLATRPDVQASVTGSRLTELRLPGLSRQTCLMLLSRLAGRGLDETERAWAVDLWFESEGLPQRFVQAGVLLRHREAAIEALAAGLPGPEWLGPANGDPSVELLDTGTMRRIELDEARPTPGGFEAYLRQHGGTDEGPLPDPVPLPSVAESAAPAVRIARGLSEPARRTLRLATALGGECPNAPHLPALIDVGHGEAALDELVEAGLATVSGGQYRLIDGVSALLLAEWPDVADTAREAAQHFTWWTGHSSVTEEQVAAEAEVLLGAMHADREAGRHPQVVLLARAAAPSFALALRWGAWERALRFGLESARSLGAVAEEAWFHHELGVLALAVGAYDRARSELEASVALRGALGDQRGTAAGRAALERLGAALRLPSGSTAALGGRAGAALPGLRRLAPFARRRPDEGPVTRRQLAAAALGVVLMGVLGAGVAVGVGAFQNVGSGDQISVPPATTSPAGPASSGADGSGPAVPAGASPSTSASGSASASAGASSSSATPSGGPSGALSPSPSASTPDPGLSPSTPPPHTQSPTPPPSPTKTTPPPPPPSTTPPTQPPTTPASTSTAAVPGTASSS